MKFTKQEAQDYILRKYCTGYHHSSQVEAGSQSNDTTEYAFGLNSGVILYTTNDHSEQETYKEDEPRDSYLEFGVESFLIFSTKEEQLEHSKKRKWEMKAQYETNYK